MSDNPQVVVAGHICVDLIPRLDTLSGGLETLLRPGKLIEIGPAVVSTGGAVSNTGLALHRLGVMTKLMGKIGDDLFGTAILDYLGSHDDALATGMIVGKGESSSYTIVISPPGLDRMFLHCPGTNDTFGAEDVDLDELEGARIFHFGYPPLMRRMYVDGGVGLASLMSKVKVRGLTTSLDTAYPDPDSEAGMVDWVGLLERVLPHVDFFLPSIDEILFALDRPRHDSMIEPSTGEFKTTIDSRLMADLARRLIDMGVAVAVLKLGSQGLYVRTCSNRERLISSGASPVDTTNWIGRELIAPCFKANLVGAAGAGDCAIAGFLAGVLKGLAIEDVMTTAAAVGAFNVESLDTTSGVPDWDTVQARVRGGWERCPVDLSLPDWQWDTDRAVWLGPNDREFQPGRH
jgi:sugar/nucleoside kinase (ribokinase family)